MFRIGAHVSVSGGYHRAVEREVELGGNCGQIFAGSPRGWKVTQAEEGDAKKFIGKSREEDIKPWIVHSCYLINLATPKDELAKKSVKALQNELDATKKLGALYYVFHPGAHTGAGEEKGIKNVAERMSRLKIPEDVTLLLENTAGKGTTLGKTFEHLNKMVQLSNHGYEDLGICLDTCHLYSAGFDFTTKEKLDEIIEDFDDVIGLGNLRYIHLNDSKHPLGSEKDKHEHIGEGEIGEKAFKMFINHEELRDKPMILETPVDEKGFEWNIKKCRELRD